MNIPDFYIPLTDMIMKSRYKSLLLKLAKVVYEEKKNGLLFISARIMTSKYLRKRDEFVKNIGEDVHMLYEQYLEGLLKEKRREVVNCIKLYDFSYIIGEYTTWKDIEIWCSGQEEYLNEMMMTLSKKMDNMSIENIKSVIEKMKKI